MLKCYCKQNHWLNTSPCSTSTYTIKRTTLLFLSSTVVYIKQPFLSTQSWGSDTHRAWCWCSVKTRSPQYTLVKGLEFLATPNWCIKFVCAKIGREKWTKRAKRAQNAFSCADSGARIENPSARMYGSTGISRAGPLGQSKRQATWRRLIDRHCRGGTWRVSRAWALPPHPRDAWRAQVGRPNFDAHPGIRALPGWAPSGVRFRSCQDGRPNTGPQAPL